MTYLKGSTAMSPIMFPQKNHLATMARVTKEALSDSDIRSGVYNVWYWIRQSFDPIALEVLVYRKDPLFFCRLYDIASRLATFLRGSAIYHEEPSDILEDLHFLLRGQLLIARS